MYTFACLLCGIVVSFRVHKFGRLFVVTFMTPTVTTLNLTNLILPLLSVYLTDTVIIVLIFNGFVPSTACVI